jgi:tetratricopeptide (TPR) repeat protein
LPGAGTTIKKLYFSKSNPDTMKHFFLFLVVCCASLHAGAQSDKVALAEEALGKNDFVNAYELANTALQTPSSLDKSTLANAYFIRGKAGARAASETLVKDESAKPKFIDVPLQSYNDFKQAISLGDATLKSKVEADYTRLANALLLAGTKYDGRFKDNPENPDSSALNKGIENFTAAIDVFALTKKEKFKPYLFRGDALFAKKKFDEALDDYLKAMKLFEDSPRENPDFNIGDLGYRLAYMQLNIYNNKELAIQTIAKTRELLEEEMQLAVSRKTEKPDRFDEWKEEYEYFVEQLDDLDSKMKQ